MQLSIRQSALLLLAALAWAGSFVVVKGATVSIDPIHLGFLRFLVATPIMVLVLVLRKQKLIFSRKDIPSMAVLGLTGVTLLYIFQFTGVSLTTAATAGVLINSNVIFIALLSGLFLHEPFTYKKVGGIIISFIGVTIVVWSQSSTTGFSLSPSFIFGAVLVLSSALSWAIYSIVGKNLMKTYDMVAVTTTAFIWGSLFYLPIAPQVLEIIPSISLAGWGAVLYLALICSVFAYLGWYYVLKEVPASKAAVFLNFIPLFTIILAILLGEYPSPIFLLGAGLIIYGVYQTQQTQKRRCHHVLR